jgi:GNAT superfamily N-acetyltransferase
MTPILQLGRRLAVRPVVVVPPGLKLRTFAGEDDVQVWLKLREQAFAGEGLAVRRWNDADFRREFLSKAWWWKHHSWFAEDPSSLETVGTITLGLRGSGAAAIPVVHWLAVLPAWRRRGVARSLLSLLEARAWDLGYRQVRLETHAAWQSAVRFYKVFGYTEVMADNLLKPRERNLGPRGPV